MKKIPIILLVAILLSTSVFSRIQTIDQELSDEEMEVWNMEKAYWEYVKNRDLDGYMTLWHPNFMGWPSIWKRPSNRESLSRLVSVWFASINPGSISVELIRYSVKIYGNVAIVYYLCNRSSENLQGVKESTSSRYIHTWMKQDGKWKIIGGMSAD